MKEQEDITIQQIVGANIKQLREARRPKLTQHQLADALKVYGLKWAKEGMYRVEGGLRQIDPAEMLALADFFDVPVWYFFTPPADLAAATIIVGQTRKPAWTLLADMVRPERSTHQLAFRAYSVAIDLERTVGSDNEAFKGLMEALGNNEFPRP